MQTGDAAANDLFADMLGRVKAATRALASAGALPSGLDLGRITVEPPKDASHGDMATNAAMVLAKDAGKKPRELAEAIAEALRADAAVDSVAIAGPGFINITLKPAVWREALRAAIRAGLDYGRSRGGRAKVNVEYVSANPTGPMHVGHCRGAVFGDALASLLAFAGFDVTREYYINDAGAQVDVLARSAFLRYREALGEDIGAIPDGLYPGDYLKPVGAALARAHGDALRGKADNEWLPLVRRTAIDMMMAMIRDDLAALNVHPDVFFSERSLIGDVPKHPASWTDEFVSRVEAARLKNPSWGGKRIAKAIATGDKIIAGSTIDRVIAWLIVAGRVPPGPRSKLKLADKVGAAIEWLRARGEVYEGRLPPPKGAPVEDYEDREQTLFRSTDFGDDVDRPLKKSDGSYTYFASDIAYHKSKFDRGFHDMIDVWGADHGGYIKRMQAAVKAVGQGKAALDVKIVQLVKLLRGGEPVKMSKRSGDFVTLREVVDEVGRDAVRFMMLYRKNDAVLDFDLAKVIEQSRDNPVFYVQYGHARGHSIFRMAREAFPQLPADAGARMALLSGAALDRLTEPAEQALMRKLAQYPRLIETAANAHEPHRIAFYLYDLASEFHALWTQGKGLPHLRFIIQNDEELTVARLALVQAVVTVFASGLGLLGVGAPEEMR